jgi:hypothetical protein
VQSLLMHGSSLRPTRLGSWFTCLRAITIATCLGSIAHASDLGPPSLTRVSEAQLKDLFSKNLIIRDGLPGRPGSWSDEFTARGEYFQSGRYIPLRGSYSIRDDLVCVRDDGHAVEDCRGFYQSPNGDLWRTIPVSGGDSTPVAIGRIQVERTPNTLKGM